MQGDDQRPLSRNQRSRAVRAGWPCGRGDGTRSIRAVRVNAPTARKAGGQCVAVVSESASQAITLARCCKSGSRRCRDKSASAQPRPAARGTSGAAPQTAPRAANKPSPRCSACTFRLTSSRSGSSNASQPSTIVASAAPGACVTASPASSWSSGSAGIGPLSSEASAACHQVNRIWPTNGSRVVRTMVPRRSSSASRAANARREPGGAYVSANARSGSKGNGSAIGTQRRCLPLRRTGSAAGQTPDRTRYFAGGRPPARLSADRGRLV